jgi:hypothetical protein
LIGFNNAFFLRGLNVSTDSQGNIAQWNILIAFDRPPFLSVLQTSGSYDPHQNQGRDISFNQSGPQA